MVLVINILSTLFILSMALPLSALGMTKASWVYYFIGAGVTIWRVWV